jgi:hypothetical protein
VIPTNEIADSGSNGNKRERFSTLKDFSSRKEVPGLAKAVKEGYLHCHELA